MYAEPCGQPRSPFVASLQAAGLTEAQIEIVIDLLVEEEVKARSLRPWVWSSIGGAAGFCLGLLA